MRTLEIIFILYLFLPYQISKDFEIYFTFKYYVFFCQNRDTEFFIFIKAMCLGPKVFWCLFFFSPVARQKGGQNKNPQPPFTTNKPWNKQVSPFSPHVRLEQKGFWCHGSNFCYELWASIFLTWLLRLMKGAFLSFPNKMQMALLPKLLNRQSCVWVWISSSSGRRIDLWFNVSLCIIPIPHSKKISKELDLQ